jgi:hypothetical protein
MALVLTPSSVASALASMDGAARLPLEDESSSLTRENEALERARRRRRSSVRSTSSRLRDVAISTLQLTADIEPPSQSVTSRAVAIWSTVTPGGRSALTVQACSTVTVAAAWEGDEAAASTAEVRVAIRVLASRVAAALTEMLTVEVVVKDLGG